MSGALRSACDFDRHLPAESAASHNLLSPRLGPPRAPSAWAPSLCRARARNRSPPWLMVWLQRLCWFQGHGAEEVNEVRANGARHRPMPGALRTGDGCCMRGLTAATGMLGSRTALSLGTGDTTTGDWFLSPWGGRGDAQRG